MLRMWRACQLVMRLSVADLFYDKKVSFCMIAAIISVITPLLLLFSLKYGVVSQLRERLLNDPQNLEVKIIGNLQLDSDFFTWLDKQSETKFVLPLTRSLNTQADLMAGRSQFINNVEIIPTDINDPITMLTTSLDNQKQVILSALSAEKLGAKKGDIIKMVITRQLDGKLEKGLTELVVSDVLAETHYSRAGIFVSLPLLIEIENFYDGYQSSLFITGTGKQSPPEHTQFARARIYASSLEHVAPLALKLRETYNIETRTQASAIENMQVIDRVLGFIFIVIAMTSILGCVLSFFGAFLSNIERKRKDIAFMRLLGFKSQTIMGYLLLQALLLSGIAFIISCLLFTFGSMAFNQVLGENLASQQMVSQLTIMHFILAFLATLGISATVIIIGGLRAIKIQPAESLRDI